MLRMNKIILFIIIFFFVIGTLTTTLNPTSALVLDEDTWYTTTSMSHMRIDFGIVVVDGLIYAIGGYSYPQPLNFNERYNPQTDTWTTLAPMPTGRYNFAIVECQNKIYCIGGTAANDGTVTAPPIPPPSPPTSTTNSNTTNNTPAHTPALPPFRQINVVEAYDPATNMWTNKAHLPINAEEIHAQVINEQIFITTTNGELYMYNSITDKWSSKAPLPIKEELLQTHVINKQLFIITKNHLYVYNPITDTWTDKTDMPASMTYAFSVVMDNKIIVGNLFNITDIIYGNLYRAQLRVNIYDPAADAWHNGGTTTEHIFVFGFTLGVTSDIYAPKNIYVFGREADKEDWCNITPFSLAYDPIDNVWSTASIVIGAPYTMRETVVVDDVFYVIGGGSNVKYVPVDYYNTQEYPDTSPAPTTAPSTTPSPSDVAPLPTPSATAPSLSGVTPLPTSHGRENVWLSYQMLVIAATIVLVTCIVIVTLIFYLQRRKRNKGGVYE